MITRFFRALRRWHTRNVTIRQLTALSDWQLKDLGLSRGEIPALVDRLLSATLSSPTRVAPASDRVATAEEKARPVGAKANESAAAA